MAARKRRRPIRRSAEGLAQDARDLRTGGAPRAQAARRAQREARTAMGYLTMAEAAAVTGTSRFQMSRLIKREGIPTYELPRDRRQKLIKEQDLEQLKTPRPRPEEPGGQPGAQDAS